MQKSIVGIALLTVLLIAGVLLSTRLSGDKPQKHAVLAAFVALAAVDIAFLIVSVLLSQASLAWIFAIAAIVFPIGTYALMLRSASNRTIVAARGQAKRVSRKPAMAASPQGGEPSEPIPQIRPAAPASEPSAPMAAAAAVAVPAVAVPETAVPAAEQERRAAATVPEPVQAASASAAKPEAKRAPKHAAASKPVDRPAPEPTPQPTVFDPQAYFEKATILRDAGQFLIATRLYAECAELAESEDVRRKALMQQVACYVKGGDLSSAQKLAADMQSEFQLTAAEQLKVSAVLGAER